MTTSNEEVESSKGCLANLKLGMFSTRQKIALAALCFADFACYCSMSIMAPFFPKEAAEKGMSETLAGTLFSFYALVIFVTSPLLGKIIPKIGVKLCYSVGIIFSGVANICFGTLVYINDYTYFTILAFIIRGAEALGASAYSTASYVLINGIFPDHAGLVRGILEVFVGLGLSTGPAAGGFLFAAGGFQLPFYVLGALILSLLIFNRFLVTEQVNTNVEKSGSLRKMLKIPAVIMASVIIIVVSITWSFLDPTLEPYLRKYNLSSTTIGSIFLLMSGSYGLMSPLAGWLGDKYQENVGLIMVVGLFCSGVSLLFLGPSPVLYFLSNSVWWDVAALIFLGLSVALGLLPTYTAIVDAALDSGVFQDEIGTHSLVAGLWSSLYSLGEVIGPTTGGAFFNLWKFPITATIMAMLNFLTATISFLFYNMRSKKKKLKGHNNNSFVENDIKIDVQTNDSKPSIITTNM